MKRLLIIFVAMILQQTGLVAQEMELLDSIRQDPDPMYIERGGCTMWKSDHMVFIINDNSTIEWQLRNPPRIFINERSKLTGQELGHSYARVGLFDEKDSLLAIVDKWKAYPSGHGTILKMSADATFSRPNGETIKGTILHVWGTLLQRKNSYVRVVANIYGDYYFEVKAKLNR